MRTRSLLLLSPFYDDEGDVIGLIRPGGKGLNIFENFGAELAGGQTLVVDDQIPEPLF